MTKQIVVVDDETVFLEEFDEILKLSGYEAISFSSGEAMLESIENLHPDLILLDLKMKGKSGFQVAKELRKKPGMESVPVIAMTGFYNDEENDLLMRVCGINECLMKPIQPLEIISKIEKI